MKKLTLNETWVLCLKMWRWIVAHLDMFDGDIDELKDYYFRHVCRLRLENRPLFDCYFCEFNGQQGYLCSEDTKKPCYKCPGYLVSRAFSCGRASYDYQGEPAAFLRKLESLNKIRLAKKRK